MDQALNYITRSKEVRYHLKSFSPHLFYRAKRLMKENDLKSRKVMAGANTLTPHDPVIFPVERPKVKDPALLKTIMTLIPRAEAEPSGQGKNAQKVDRTAPDPNFGKVPLSIYTEK